MISLATMFTAERPNPKAHVLHNIPLKFCINSAFSKLPLPALDHELRQLKLKSQEPGSSAHLMPKQLQSSSNEPQTWPAKGETATASYSSNTTTHKIDSPLDCRKQELAENVSFLEVQISSAEDHSAKFKAKKPLSKLKYWRKKLPLVDDLVLYE